MSNTGVGENLGIDVIIPVRTTDSATEKIEGHNWSLGGSSGDQISFLYNAEESRDLSPPQGDTR